MMEAYVVILQITNTRTPTGFLVAFGPRRRQNEIVWIIGGRGGGEGEKYISMWQNYRGSRGMLSWEILTLVIRCNLVESGTVFAWV